jgi:hypothetical protein
MQNKQTNRFYVLSSNMDDQRQFYPNKPKSRKPGKYVSFGRNTYSRNSKESTKVEASSVHPPITGPMLINKISGKGIRVSQEYFDCLKYVCSYFRSEPSSWYIQTETELFYNDIMNMDIDKPLSEILKLKPREILSLSNVNLTDYDSELFSLEIAETAKVNEKNKTQSIESASIEVISENPWDKTVEQDTTMPNESVPRNAFHVLEKNPDKNDVDLPEPIAVIKKIKPKNGDKKEELVRIMYTVKDFWDFVNKNMVPNAKDDLQSSNLSRPLPEYENEADELEKEIIMKNDDEKTFHEKLKNYISMFPEWIFTKVPEEYIEGCTDQIRIPYIMTKENKSKNIVSFNLVDTSFHREVDLHLINRSFTGFIPDVLVEFVRGELPKSITTILFYRTITRGRYQIPGKTPLDPGFHFMLLVNSPQKKSLVMVQKLIRDEVVKRTKNYFYKGIREFNQDVKNNNYFLAHTNISFSVVSKDADE